MATPLGRTGRRHIGIHQHFAGSIYDCFHQNRMGNLVRLFRIRVFSLFGSRDNRFLSRGSSEADVLPQSKLQCWPHRQQKIHYCLQQRCITTRFRTIIEHNLWKNVADADTKITSICIASDSGCLYRDFIKNALRNPELVFINMYALHEGGVGWYHFYLY